MLRDRCRTITFLKISREEVLAGAVVAAEAVEALDWDGKTVSGKAGETMRRGGKASPLISYLTN
jgi:hypothetical protein